jgi:diguanylate cyclase (GGDEF)-like protein/PAS domain S-box-containing protein
MSHWPASAFIAPLILSLLVSLNLGVRFIRRRQGSWLYSLAGLFLAMGVWTLGYLLEILAPTLEQKQFFANVQYLGITTVPVFWLLFAMRLTGYGGPLNIPARFALFSMPLVTQILMWTNAQHGLMRSSVTLQAIGPIVILAKTYGPWFWVHSVFSYGALFIGSALMMHNVIRSRSMTSQQKIILTIAVSLPWVSNILYLTRLSPLHGLDLTPVFFPIAGLMLYWAVYPLRLDDLIPLARDTVLDSLSDMFLVINQRDQIMDVNTTGQRLLKRSLNELVGQPLSAVMPQVHSIKARFGDTGEIHTEVDLSEGWHELHVSPLRNPGGDVVGRLVSLRDIQRRKQTELELFKLKEELEDRVEQRTAELMESEKHLRFSQARLEAIFNNVAAGICQLDTDGCFISFNDTLANMLGYPRIEMAHFRIRDVMHPSEQPLDTKWLLTHLKPENESNSYERRFIRRDGTAFWGNLSLSPILDSRGELIAILCLILDISVRKRYENQVLHNALHDSLTGLPNRALVLDRLEQAIQHCHLHPSDHYAVLYLDFDHFKDINDSLGHGFGDRLLIESASRLQSQVYMTDTVARLGGDEFVVLVNESREGGNAAMVATGILETLRNPFMLDGRQVFITCSIGIVRNLGWYKNADDVLRDADTAMYQAKMSGRNHYEIFDAEMRARAMVRLEMETGLRRAISLNELSLQFQPIVSLASHQVVGFETLARWHHPRLGLISPVEFIPLAEETGLIAPIGNWVLEQACRYMSEWHQQHPTQPPLYIAVNISARHFVQPDFAEMVSSTLARYNLPAHGLVIEITEGMLLEDQLTTEQTMHKLSELGVRVAIDDFGTGYSSLSYLHRYSIHTLKIDRSFIARLGHEGDTPNGIEIIRAIIAMAREMSIQVVAKGIENVQQLRLLEALECEYGQGFLISPPLLPDKVSEFLEATKGEGAFEEFIQAALKQRPVVVKH